MRQNIPTYTSLPRRVRDGVQQLAKKQNRNLSQQIAHMLELDLEERGILDRKERGDGEE